MKLTYQAISDAPKVINPEGKLTLQLRDRQIQFIENIASTQDRFQVLDLTNNELVELANIPPGFHNLEVLLLANNNIRRVAEIPDNRIRSISLANNSIAAASRDWACFKHLQNLVLVGNPITKRPNYRAFFIWLIPSLKVLDFERVRESERKAGSMFGDWNDLALAFLVQHEQPIDENERRDLLEKLESAESIGEIERIERALKRGKHERSE